MTEEEDAKCF